jgi:hypothetical protein
MRGVTAGGEPGARATAPDLARDRRHGTLVATIVLIMLTIMIVRDIVVRRWTTSPTTPPDVTRSR